MAMSTSRRAGALLAVAAALLAGCGGDPASEPQATDPAAAERARLANAAMRATTFHATGTTTAVANATVETWYDPAQGLYSVVKRNFVIIGEMFCRDGVSAVSRSIADSEASAANAYVVTRLPGGCADLFAIPVTAQAPVAVGDSRVVDDRQAAAVKVKAAGEEAQFWIAADGEPYILRQESVRGYRSSVTRYTDFGTAVTIPPLPPT
jgi:hypothetical protein